MTNPFKTKLLCLAMGIALTVAARAATAQIPSNPDRECYFGDTHAHSQLSTDAFGFSNRLDPDNAYRFARGEKAHHVPPDSEEIQLKVPLDFFMMTDHSEMMGIAAQALDETSPVYNTELGKLLRANTPKSGGQALFQLQNAVGSGVLPEGYTFDSFRQVWQQVVAAAETAT